MTQIDELQQRRLERSSQNTVDAERRRQLRRVKAQLTSALTGDAAGFGGEWCKFIPGQNLLCRVESQEIAGYNVTVLRGNLTGFFATDEKLKVGQEVLAQYVMYSGGRVLLQPRTTPENLTQRPYRTDNDFDS